MSRLFLSFIIKMVISTLVGVAIGLHLGDTSLAIIVAIVMAATALLSYQLDAHFQKLYDCVDDEE